MSDSAAPASEHSSPRRTAIGDRVGQLVLTGIEQGITARWEPAQRRAANLPSDDIPACIVEIRRAFRTELGVAGAAAGGVSAVPGAVAPGVAAGVAEISWSTVRIADMILTVAVVHGHDQASVEERRAWVLAVLAYGNAAATTFTALAREMGIGLGKKATTAIPATTLRALNRALGRTIVTKYGTKRGAVALGRLLPLGIGAGIGYGMNVLLVNQVAGHADKFFRDLPAELAKARAQVTDTDD